METINSLIDKFTHMTTVKYTKKIRRLIMILFFLSACLLLTIRSYIFTGFLFVLLVGEFVYLTVILEKKNVLTIYNGIGVSFVLFLQLFLLFNSWLYSIQRFYGHFNPILLTIIFLIEILCLITGFLYTHRCVRKGTICKPRAASVSSIAFVLPTVSGYLLSRYISNNVSIQFQNVLFTVVSALACCMTMFVTGMAHVAILYYIKKYNIADRQISNTEGTASIYPSVHS